MQVAGRNRRGRRPRQPRCAGHHRGRGPQSRRPAHGGPAAVPEGRRRDRPQSFLSRTVIDTLPAPEERAAVPDAPRDPRRGSTSRCATAPSPSSPTSSATRSRATSPTTCSPIGHRRQLHRAVAEWHERAYTGEEQAPHYALLAHHWARANDPDKAVTYLERAGRQALRGGAFREALLFLNAAAEVEGAHAGPDPRRAVPEGRRDRALLPRRLRPQPRVPRARRRAARRAVPVHPSRHRAGTGGRGRHAGCAPAAPRALSRAPARPTGS